MLRSVRLSVCLFHVIAQNAPQPIKAYLVTLFIDFYEDFI